MIKHIKEKIRQARHKFAFLYFLLIMVIYVPYALTLPSHSFRSAIITAIGVDTYEQGVEVSVLTLSDISKTNMGENTKLVSGNGITVANAISSIEINLGRKIRMGHVGFVAVSKEVASNNIVDILNTLILTSKLPNTVPLVMVDKSSKELLKKTNELEQSSSFKMREIIHTEFNETFSKDTNIDEFLKGYLSPLSISTVGYITIDSDQSNGIDAGGGSSNSNEQGQKDLLGTSMGGGQGEKQEDSIINFRNEHAIFVNGKFKYVLSKQEMDGINWIAENGLKKVFTIDGVTEQGLNDAKITFEVTRQTVNPKVKFKNNKPTLTFDLSIVIDIAEISQKGVSGIPLREFVLTKSIKDKIKSKIKQEISFSINKMRENKTDVVGIFQSIYNNYSDFEKFWDTLDDKEDFLSFVKIDASIYCQMVSNK